MIINKLIVIAGTSCSGKTFLIHKLKQDGYSDLRKQLEMNTPALWEHYPACRFKQICKAEIDKLIIHYDFASQSLQKQQFRILQDLIKNSKTALVLTLCAPQKILLKRNRRRMVKLIAMSLLNFTDFRQKNKLFLRQWKLQKRFKNSFGNISLYSEWFDVIKDSAVKSFWLNSSNTQISTAHVHPPASGLPENARKIIKG